MLRIKKLDIYVLKNFGLLFLGTFFICLFIFMMQFLWRYIDVMVGKGLEMSVLAQFFFYAVLTLIPLSLPLAVLLASLITFGNFGERFELLAMKAAGISLIKIMRPLIFLVSFICIVSFYFQNVIGPMAQSKLWTLVISMKQKSPELDIPEGIFYDEIEGYNIYVKHKDRKTGMLHDILIYNFKKGFDNAQILKADLAKLEMTADKQHLYLHLYDGEEFENLRSQNMNEQNVPYRREKFKEKHIIIEFDSDFKMIDEGFMATQSNSKNIFQLQRDIDSIKTYSDSVGRQIYAESMRDYYQPLEKEVYNSESDSLKKVSAVLSHYNTDSILSSYTLVGKEKVYSRAQSRAESAMNNWDYKMSTSEDFKYSLRRHMTGWHEKLTLSLACLIFFFIGAPLGGIIRKGGLGLPVVTSVLIFIFYYILNNTGYKMARDGHWIVWMGMWMSTFILAPIGAFLTYKANNDSVILNPDVYVAIFKRLLCIRSKRHLVRKEVIIHDPVYSVVLDKLKNLTEKCENYLKEQKLRSIPNYFKLWLLPHHDDEIAEISAYMEKIIEELSNSRSSVVIDFTNKYPILLERAHLEPFKHYALNLLCGIIVPIGLFSYFRICFFRVRLEKDLKRIIQTDKELEGYLKTKIETNNK